MTRKLVTGVEVPELDQAVTLGIKTKCPAKWLLIDLETGEMYSPYETPGTRQWQKIQSDIETPAKKDTPKEA